VVTTEAAHDVTSSTLAFGDLTSRAQGAHATPITVVHGFAQNRHCLGPLSDALVELGPVRAVDAPGHGGSAVHAAADLWRGAELLAATVRRGALVGYSMGARLSLHTALRAPEQVTSLVLIGGTAGIDDDDERAARRASDEELARRLERDGLERFVESWLALPLFAGLPAWARFDEQRRSNTVEGLAGSLRAAGTGSMEPLWESLARIRCPVLCVTGALDDRYGLLVERIVAAVGGPAEHVVIADAGHAAHLEQPRATASAVTAFLRR